MRPTLLFVALVVAATTLLAQQTVLVGAQFDVVSIRPSKADTPAGGMRTLPDGTFMATNIRIRQIMNAASPEPVVDMSGLPDWVMTERYDIMAKPAPDSHPSREERNQMMRNMMIERFKVAGHCRTLSATGSRWWLPTVMDDSALNSKSPHSIVEEPTGRNAAAGSGRV